MGLSSCLAEALPYVVMVTNEILLVCLTILSKAALSKGMNRYAFVFYANVLSTLILFSLSFIFERKKRRPPLTFCLLAKFFFMGLIGISINQALTYAGIDYSSPLLQSAIANLTPAFTFLLAVLFRMEKLKMRSSTSQMKIIGTLVSISGALTVTLYKGFPIGGSSGYKCCFPVKSFLLQPRNLFATVLATERNWVIGAIFCAIPCFGNALWLNIQGAIVKEYPAEITILAFYFLFGAIQSAAVSLVVEKNQLSAWIIRPDIELLSVIGSALIGSVLTFSVATWCIEKKGPVFAAMFKPLSIAIAAIMGVIILGETLHVGTIIGSIVIVTGFYGVMWAKSKENEKQEDSEDDFLPSHSEDDFLPSSSKKRPLLQNPRDVQFKDQKESLRVSDTTGNVLTRFVRDYLSRSN